MAPDQRRAWLDRTFFAGIADSKRPAKFIYRAPLSADLKSGGTTSEENDRRTRSQIESLPKNIDGPVFVEFKHNWSHAYSYRFVVSYIWQLPSLKNSAAPVRYIFGDWETNGIISLQAGRGLTITSGRDNSQSGTNQDRADVVGDWYLAPNRGRDAVIAQWFNPAAFAQNPAGTFGASGRNIVTSPGDATIDFGVVKAIPITERWKMQFRAEFFNLLNRVNLSNPNTNASSAQFGRITSAGSPRVVQLALKLSF
jgi:hypothetical protein